MSFSNFNRIKGFTILELVVSVGIMLAIISMVLFNQSTYTKDASLRNLANDISLFLRQAQIYGISVKALPSDSSDFTSAYGVDFNISPNSGSPTTYLFFADRVGTQNGYYDYSGGWESCPLGGTSECLQKITTSTGNTISSLCLIYNDDTTDCSILGASITFLRPNTNATIVLFGASGQISPSSNHKGVEIELTGISGGTRSVLIYNTGQISVR